MWEFVKLGTEDSDGRGASLGFGFGRLECYIPFLPFNGEMSTRVWNPKCVVKYGTTNSQHVARVVWFRGISMFGRYEASKCNGDKL